jgi:hypothetical protein
VSAPRQDRQSREYVREVRQWIAEGRLTPGELIRQCNLQLPPESAAIALRRVLRPGGRR